MIAALPNILYLIYALHIVGGIHLSGVRKLVTMKQGLNGVGVEVEYHLLAPVDELALMCQRYKILSFYGSLRLLMLGWIIVSKN